MAARSNPRRPTGVSAAVTPSADVSPAPRPRRWRAADGSPVPATAHRTTPARLPSRATGPDRALTRADVTGTSAVSRVRPRPEARPERATGGKGGEEEPRPPQPSRARAEPRGKALVGGLVGLDDAGRDATAVAHRVAVLTGPVADGAGLLAVHAAAGRARAPTTGGAVAAAHLAGGRDVAGESVTHLLGVLLCQVYLVRGPVQGKAHRLVG